MEIEIERRFLLKYLPADLDKYKYTIVEDIKILTGEPHPHLRLRKKGDALMLTKKYKKEDGDSTEMIEETIHLNELEYNTLKGLKHTGQKKVRFYYKDAEIDIWIDGLKGLAIFESEFDSVVASESYILPDFCLCEITNQEWISTGMLSGKVYSDFKIKLEQLGYGPIFLPNSITI